MALLDHGRRHCGDHEYVHSLVDDHSRLAYSELHRDERAATVVAFLERALAFFADAPAVLPVP